MYPVISFFIIRDQFHMTSDQFKKADDQNWPQNQLVRLAMGWP
jgi:hypothetical protein